MKEKIKKEKEEKDLDSNIKKKKILFRKNNSKKVKPEKKESIKKERIVKLENPEDKGANFSLIEVIVIILITGLIVSVCSGLIVYNNYDKFSKVSSTQNETDLSEFINSYNHIINSYVKDVNKSELLDAAIKGMYNYLNDVYSIYVDEETTETLTERLEGKYEGIGIEISMNENMQIYITKIFSNTPAEEAGLKAGDIITSLDGESYEAKTSSDLASAIKNSDKSNFTVGYTRDGVAGEVNVERKLVYIDSVTSAEYDNVGYIKIDTFAATTSDQVKNKVNAFSDNIKSLIIDVRDNSGGYLSSAYSTADLFVDKGKVIYQLKDKSGTIEKKTASIKPIKKFDKIVVLINGASASASEILAAALNEDLNAVLVGSVSYGKGTVQETEKLSSGAMVKYTTAYWLTPEGNSINEVGLIPEYGVEDDTNTTDDEQLLKAIEVAK